MNDDREIVSSRVFDAPPEVLFRAWTDPEQLPHWRGPNGFTTTFQEFAMRPGGSLRYVMHGPDGIDYRNHSVIVELVAPERIVLDHVSGPKFRLTATLAAAGAKTRPTWPRSPDRRPPASVPR